MALPDRCVRQSARRVGLLMPPRSRMALYRAAPGLTYTRSISTSTLMTHFVRQVEREVPDAREA
ncbi:MAG: hypothetical protein JWQ68_2386 [Cryobacterium sp.]|jgi:hypothetical protein|nr:hypothetical protein [Cryobacterium sp.]